MRRPLYRVTMDQAFDQVIESCAKLRTINGEETWITDEMKSAYCQLHNLGYAHSVECWQNETLAGGLYGIALDKVFFGESMFFKKTDASKVAFYHLVQFALKNNFSFIDAQQPTEHLKSLGAEPISRTSFLELLEAALQKETLRGKWTDLLE